MKPHLIMPMGGAGSRFYREGFVIPKPLIEINGRPFLYWATQSIKKSIEIDDITFVVLQQHIKNNEIDKVIKRYYPEAHIVAIPEVLPGPVLTCLKGIEGIDNNAPVIFNDCDHMFRCNNFSRDMNSENVDAQGLLLTFEAHSPQFSYVKYDGEGNIVGTVEKKVISNHAICGAYAFQNATIFRNASEKYLRECNYSECFVSGVYNIMCRQGMKIKDYLLDFHVEFGTPEEYEKAKTSEHFNEFMK